MPLRDGHSYLSVERLEKDLVMDKGTLTLIETFQVVRRRYVVATSDGKVASELLAKYPEKRKVMSTFCSAEDVMSAWSISEDTYVQLVDSETAAANEQPMTPEEKEAFIIKIPDSQIEA